MLELIKALHQQRFEVIESTQARESIAIAAGIYLAGKKAATFLDPSGLLSALGTLKCLNVTYNLPFLGFLVTNTSNTSQLEEELLLHKTKLEPLRTDESIATQLIQAQEYMKNVEKSFIFSTPQKELLELPERPL